MVTLLKKRVVIESMFHLGQNVYEMLMPEGPNTMVEIVSADDAARTVTTSTGNTYDADTGGRIDRRAQYSRIMSLGWKGKQGK